ncbi:MAG: monovalent cation/H(+) antiporter subunit G [Clostridia bacterium]|nr:monovalent cation/H(+) antiporter subunit G [Clostridia bacterium]
MIQLIRFILGAVCMLAGLIVCIIGVAGVFKFRYAANRMHSAAINDTLGISLCMVGLAILAPDGWAALKLLFVVFFFWISAPVASHLLCRLEIETNEERHQYMEIHVEEDGTQREETVK